MNTDRIGTLQYRQLTAVRRRDYWRMVSQMPDCTEGVKLLAQRMEERLEAYCHLISDLERILTNEIKEEAM